MSGLISIIALLIFVSGYFRLLDVIRDREDKEKFKARIEKFWFDTAEINGWEQFNKALCARFQATRRLRFSFLKIFWAVCAISTIIGTFEISSQEDQTAQLTSLINLNFNIRYSVHCGYILIQQQRTESQDFCVPEKNFADFPQLNSYRAEKAGYDQYVEGLKSHPFLLRTAMVVSEVLTVFLIAVPLSAALWFSFNITLRLLSKVTGSRLYYAFLVIFTLGIALVMPPILTSIFPLIFLGLSIFAFGQPLDLFTFSAVNWVTLTFGLSMVILTFSYFLPIAGFLLAFLFPGIYSYAVALLVLWNAPVIMAYFRVKALPDDLTHLLDLSFSVDSISACIDWAIGIDLLFSFTYLVPCLALVLANRNPKTQKAFLNSAMWIHDHNKGPYIAMSELFDMFSRLIKK